MAYTRKLTQKECNRFRYTPDTYKRFIKPLEQMRQRSQNFSAIPKLAPLAIFGMQWNARFYEKSKYKPVKGISS